MAFSKDGLRKWSRRIFVGLNFLCVIGLLCSYLATHVAPSSFWPFSFFGLAYPLFLLFNVLFLTWWIIRKKRKLMWVSLVTILLGFSHLTHFIQLSTTGSHDEDGKESFKLLSYNVRLFDLYGFMDKEETRDSIFKLLQKSDPDILCFQEFYHTDRPGYFETKNTLKPLLRSKNVHEHFDYYPAKQQYFGVVTMSRFPILKKGNIPFEGKLKNHCIFTDLKINKDTVRIYNVHLASIRFGKDDYAYMSAINQNTGDAADLSRGRRILSRLKRAFIEREKQIRLITDHMDQCKHPVILAGDFNDAPISWAYRQMNNRLTDAFTESGNGIGATYIGEFPSFRIDYIFHSDAFNSYEFKIHPEELSDHHAIEAKLQLME